MGNRIALEHDILEQLNADGLEFEFGFPLFGEFGDKNDAFEILWDGPDSQFVRLCTLRYGFFG